jgi:NAD(P)-dependent dehydrogenase (short-subunit alcohol dehydrogenase family)
MAELQGKTALVTGASRGIGRVIAWALAESGAYVLVHYGRSTQDAESLVNGIRAKGGRADAICADLGIPDGATFLAKQVRSVVGERMDVLVANAGVSKGATIGDHTVEDFDNPLRNKCTRTVFPGAATPARSRGRLEHHFDLFSRSPVRSGHARSR